MKCPKCSANHRYSAGMTCVCGYAFALDPKRDGIGDRRFLAFINGASCNGTYHFTENQLYTAACRKQISSPIVVLILLACVFAGALAYIVMNQRLGTVPPVTACVAGVGILCWLYAHYIQSVPRKKFDGWTKKYAGKHGPIELLVREGYLNDPPPEAIEPDIYDYGVERILVVQRPLLVDLLVANNAHAANRALILSGDGYPKYLAPIAEKLLEESPALPVFLLHDATGEGIAWAERTKVKYAAGERRVVDLGMTPDAMQRIKKLHTLRLGKTDYAAPVDVLPMAMMMSGVGMAMDQGIGMEDLLVMGTSPDSNASFG